MAIDPPPAPDNGEGPSVDAPLTHRRLAALLLGPALCALLLMLPAPDGMNAESWRLVALASWMVTWWLGEAVPIPATALLPLSLMPLLGIQAMKPVAASYGHPLIFLFLGGFFLAAALQRWGLHKRLALGIVRRVGVSPGRLIAGFMIATAFLSMWISNTATTIMMFAVGLSVIDFVASQTPDSRVVRRFGVALMLGIAYAASIGGVGTLIGTPPNALLASFLQSTYAIEINFFTWMTFGVPIVIVMLPLAWVLLTRVAFPLDGLAIGNANALIEREITALGAMSRGEKTVAVIFVATALGWIFRSPLAGLTGLPINDTMIALLAATALFALPVSRQQGRFALDWASAKAIPWGVLLLFGGGLALAGAFKSTGLATWIGTEVSGFDVGVWTLVFIVTVAIVYLTEITSNTASTATFLPILGAVAVGLALDPRLLTIPVALGASMAFMMPVATPPNAIVFSYDGMKLADMAKAGFWLNIAAIAITFAAMMLLAPLVFGL